MVYGPNCKGNFPRLIKIAKYTPVFDIKNDRSMIYIDNLIEFLKLIIVNRAMGVYYPQNKDYMNTTLIIKVIAKIMGRKIWFTRSFMGILKFMAIKLKIINKIFGSKYYDRQMSDHFNWSYCIVNSIDSLKMYIDKEST